MAFKGIASKITKNKLCKAARSHLWDKRRGRLALAARWLLCPDRVKSRRLNGCVCPGTLSPCCLPSLACPLPFSLFPSVFVPEGEMVLSDKMIHLVIAREKSLLFPQNKEGTGVRNILTISQHLTFYCFAICPHRCSPLKKLWHGSMGGSSLLSSEDEF